MNISLHQGMVNHGPEPGDGPARSRRRGFTLVEMMIALVICVLLLTIGVPTYQSYLLRAKNSVAIADIGQIELAIGHYGVANNGALPNSLADVGMDAKLDPWGNPYQYLNISTVPGNSHGIRKDHNLVPINTDYDLYSMGPDGSSAGPLTAQQSQDDIIRANNGAYIGLASAY